MVRARPTAPGTLALEIRGANDALHYAATAELADPNRAPARPAALRAVAGHPLAGAVYDGHLLFHGAAFQVIDDLSVSADGANATLRGTTWPGGWATDPLALDGGLQLALLWTREALGGASLPMGFDAFHAYRTGPMRGPIRATLPDQTICPVMQ